MPRTGGVYTPPAGTKGVSNTPILSVPYNAFIDDLTADANAARPITAGGTGATSASQARTNLAVPGIAGSNSFTGSNTFGGAVNIASAAPTIVFDDTDNPVQHVIGPFSSGQVFRLDVDRDNEMSGSEFRLYIDATQYYRQTTGLSHFTTDLVTDGNMTIGQSGGTAAPTLTFFDSTVASLSHLVRSFGDNLSLESDAANVLGTGNNQVMFRAGGLTVGGVFSGGIYSIANTYLFGASNSNDYIQFSDVDNSFGFVADGTTAAAELVAGAFRTEIHPSTPGSNAFNFNVAGAKSMSRSTTSPSTQLGFYNPNGLVGQVNTSASGTTYQTTSDETRKIRTGYLSGADAIAVILADPVWEYDWKPEFGGTSDIGWGAQTSMAIHPSLASAPYWMDEVEGTEVQEGTEGAIYIPAGMDLGRRTPFLWAATANLISRIEELETRLAALEAGA